MAKFQLTYASCCEFVTTLGYPVDAERDAVNILCLEGAQPLPELPGLLELSGNDPDHCDTTDHCDAVDRCHPPDGYNDSVAIFWHDGEGQHTRALKATTEPGRYYTQVRPHRLGAANLVWGHHQYKRGRHRRKPALVSASGLDRVWRDKDGDFSQDMTEKVYTGRFGIHVHAGGKGESIGRWSAGCVAIWGGYEGEPYLFFLERVEAHPGKLIGLTLWGARDIVKWMQNKEGWRPRLRYGIGNPWVADVQRLLNSHLDSRLLADGDWGPMTQGYFLRFQQEKGLAVDGICGPLSWAALLCCEVGMRLRGNIENNDTASNEMEVVDDN